CIIKRYRLVANGLCSAPASETGTLSGDVVRPAPRLGPRLVHASSSCGADGRFAVGAAGALKDFPVCQRATQAMSVVTLIRGWVLARHRRWGVNQNIDCAARRRSKSVHICALHNWSRGNIAQVVTISDVH